ncbi:unnamed protein product [Calypogeia fissa]
MWVVKSNPGCYGRFDLVAYRKRNKAIASLGEWRLMGSKLNMVSVKRQSGRGMEILLYLVVEAWSGIKHMIFYSLLYDDRIATAGEDQKTDAQFTGLQLLKVSRLPEADKTAEEEQSDLPGGEEFRFGAADATHSKPGRKWGNLVELDRRKEETLVIQQYASFPAANSSPRNGIRCESIPSLAHRAKTKNSQHWHPCEDVVHEMLRRSPKTSSIISIALESSSSCWSTLNPNL